jgi:SAM-dependent MidA family methyltransferase
MSQFVHHARILPGVDGGILLAMSDQVAEAIRGAIRDHGPITFAEFMERALYGPGGFYEDPPVGADGDFITSPHVHPVFGAMVGTAVGGLFAALDEPEPIRIAEVGAGDGTLATQVLATLAGRDVDYEAVEAGAGARATLSAIDGVRAVAELDGAPHVVIANELLDNLPFRRVRGDREVRVGVEGDRFVEVETPWDGEPCPSDVETIVPVGAFAFLDRLASTITHGYALLIDYGGVGTSAGGIHGYRDHRVIEDVLADPGSADITAGVDFAQIANHAEQRGLLAFPTVTQQEALTALGFEDWLRTERERQTSLLDAREGLEAVRTWSGRSRATLLVDPSALGRLRWLVLATPGLPAPDWLGSAAQ